MKTYLLASSLLALALVSCSGASAPSDLPTENTATNSPKSSREDCMKGCEMMWKGNEGNKGKSATQMNTDCANLCDAGQGMQNNDLTSCDKSEGILKNTCYLDVAKQRQDLALCEKIDSPLFVNTCYIDIAKAKNDKSICEKISDKIYNEICTDAFKEAKE